MGITGQGVRGDNRGQINRFGFRCFSFSSTWCRSLLLSFSTCYLGVLGLEGAINCILAQTSRQRTTFWKEDKSSAPKVSFIRRFHCSQLPMACYLTVRAETDEGGICSTWAVKYQVLLLQTKSVLDVSGILLYSLTHWAYSTNLHPCHMHAPCQHLP